MLNETAPGDSALRLARAEFAQPRGRGAEADVAFAYESYGQSSQVVTSERVALTSWVENWYPVPVSPDGYTAAGAAAPGTTRFHLPRGWRSVSNGRLTSRRMAGSGVVDTWTVERPVARSFAAAPYVAARQAVGGREIAVYLLSATQASAQAQARILARAVAAMERRFGPYPYPTYAIAEIPDGAVTWAAGSEQGFIMARSDMFDAPGGNLPLFAHEAAHGWWGNVVNTSGPGSKLGSESLAQYGAVVAIETLEGAAAAREFLRFSRTGYNPLQCALGYFHIWREGGDKALAQLEEDKWDHNLSDSKGMWFYEMVRRRMGDQAFFGALRGLIGRFATRPMTLSDIRAAFLAAAPADSGLAGFLSQWLDRKGAPVLDADWWSVRQPPASSNEKEKLGATIRIRQRQPGEPYVLPMEVALTLRDSTRVVDTLRLREREQAFELELPARAVSLELDPFHRVLMWRPEYGPRPPGAE